MIRSAFGVGLCLHLCRRLRLDGRVCGRKRRVTRGRCVGLRFLLLGVGGLIVVEFLVFPPCDARALRMREYGLNLRAGVPSRLCTAMLLL